MSTHVDALRSTWRTTAEQYKAQAARFGRIFAATLVPQLVQQYLSSGDLPHVDRAFLIAVVVPAVEVAWRQLHPALTASQVDAAPGATIVPEQVGLPAPLPASEPEAAPDPASPAPAEVVDLDTIPEDITP